jgi:hypothetical protein
VGLRHPGLKADDRAGLSGEAVKLGGAVKQHLGELGCERATGRGTLRRLWDSRCATTARDV